MSERPVTVITGTSRGIGRELAHLYARRGHTVVGCSRSDTAPPAEGWEQHVVDVTDEPAVRGLFKDVSRKHGRVDHVINNAGIGLMNHAMLTPLPAARRVLDTNVTGTLLVSREAAKVMAGARFGRIVNFGSVAAPLRLEGEAVYAASKAAVVTLTEVLARELAAFGITVNTVAPSVVRTHLTSQVPRDKIEDLISRQAIGREATVDDIANVVDFYLRPESDFLTGQTLYLGGAA